MGGTQQKLYFPPMLFQDIELLKSKFILYYYYILLYLPT